MTAAVIAILIRKEKDLVQHFRANRALSQGTALTLNQLTIDEDRTFRRLRNAEVIREAARDHFYLDESTLLERRRSSRRVTSVIAIVLAVLAVILVTMQGRAVAN